MAVNPGHVAITVTGDDTATYFPLTDEQRKAVLRFGSNPNRIHTLHRDVKYPKESIEQWIFNLLADESTEHTKTPPSTYSDALLIAHITYE